MGGAALGGDDSKMLSGLHPQSPWSGRLRPANTRCLRKAADGHSLQQFRTGEIDDDDEQADAACDVDRRRLGAEPTPDRVKAGCGRSRHGRPLVLMIEMTRICVAIDSRNQTV